MNCYRVIHTEDFTEEQIDGIINSLPAWRKAEAMRFKHRQGQVECALSYWLLSRMLGFRPDFTRGEHGKPALKFTNSRIDELTNYDYRSLPTRQAKLSGERSSERQFVNLSICQFANLPIYFNLSHCRNAIACVVSDEGETGIDVECLGRYKPQLAEYCMSDEELHEIACSDNKDEAFTLLWTKKEALLKLTGEGITDDMKGCLTSSRVQGVTFESGVNREKGYAWTVASRKLKVEN